MQLAFARGSVIEKDNKRIRFWPSADIWASLSLEKTHELRSDQLR